MAIKIEKKITGYEVVKAGDREEQPSNVTHIAPLLERDDILDGITYKIKTPMSDHAMYITINDVVVNVGTPDEHRRPFEVFINSKNMEHFMWIVALTRVISAIFRKGGDITFLVEEMKAVFDPRGGYYKRGGRYMPSLVAEIGEVIQQHLVSIGMMEGQLDTPELEAKRREVKERLGDDAIAKGNQCDKCGAMAVIRLDNCNTCLECGDSKCG
ncbi:MAG: TSCPD domain-containing protein [Zetaproteobacteria bacterium CG_4_9_14_3_um_filter_49_83]|nr:MAG: TSCPD domain-containing protein [Zetaproteobacteria bacterium CG1_02_49_23]PIQ34710.1 MAG: TSCPD domain-containing protein [Zetaproteobacteria bacterium CG17_big_fil_post_rev_8_21_14_2_50_50_13]PIV30595.1 MAG: TSCPD domain-containing protein [Zetaproteobacteria bacterium CG02_land_8_20_14_3_00_50_9]PIY55005.1 MAG: TSCPD domain-containing protein [Zetaproteobacteria bacterium CG_4_10_14_0_8_um_filter_49_80]PJA34293.1 MAG: TSCPD domain-containing protein [Zetaproteobacteria bacterium CG_4